MNKLTVKQIFIATIYTLIFLMVITSIAIALNEN